METKLAQLKSLLRELGSVLVAYSGGVDSTFVASLSHEILGERSLAVTANSPIFSPRETGQAQSLAQHLGLRHVLIETNQLDDPSFVANDPQRCYHCKRELYQRLNSIANERIIGPWVPVQKQGDLSQEVLGLKDLAVLPANPDFATPRDENNTKLALDKPGTRIVGAEKPS